MQNPSSRHQNGDIRPEFAKLLSQTCTSIIQRDYSYSHTKSIHSYANDVLSKLSQNAGFQTYKLWHKTQDIGWIVVGKPVCQIGLCTATAARHSSLWPRKCGGKETCFFLANLFSNNNKLQDHFSLLIHLTTTHIDFFVVLIDKFTLPNVKCDFGSGFLCV